MSYRFRMLHPAWDTMYPHEVTDVNVIVDYYYNEQPHKADDKDMSWDEIEFRVFDLTGTDITSTLSAEEWAICENAALAEMRS